jgi:Flp pilus assembly CpaE family ATPase
MPDVTQSILRDDDADANHIRLVSALTVMSDENALFNTYPANGPGKVRFVARAQTLSDVEDIVRRYRANVFLIDHQMTHSAGAGQALVTLIQRLRHNPEYPIVTFGLCYDPTWVKTFEDAGALGTVAGPLTALELQRLNDELPVALNKAMQERLRPDYISRFSDGAIRLIDSGAWQRQTISVWSTKGGVGKSFLAREIAVALGVLCDRRTLLVDADMNCGDQHTYLRLTPDKNIWSLSRVFCANGNTLTPAMVQQYLTPYGGNLSVLLGAHDMAMTAQPELRGRQGEAYAEALMDNLGAMGFDFIIFDLGQNFAEPMHLVPLRRCSLNLVVVTSEKSTALEMEMALNGLRSDKDLKLDNTRFRLLINKWDDRMGLDSRELIRRLGLPEFARIPYGTDLRVDISLNQSKPLVLDPPNEVSNAIVGAVKGLYRPLEIVWDKRSGKAGRKGGLRFGRHS